MQTGRRPVKNRRRRTMSKMLAALVSGAALVGLVSSPVHEGTDALGALRRSTELVRRRWWHAAFVTATPNGIVGVTAMAVSLLLLLLFTGIPLWLFSIFVSLVYVFVVPLAAIAMNLLHGDAVAAGEGLPAAEPVSVDEPVSVRVPEEPAV